MDRRWNYVQGAGTVLVFKAVEYDSGAITMGQLTEISFLASIAPYCTSATVRISSMENE